MLCGLGYAALRPQLSTADVINVMRVFVCTCIHTHSMVYVISYLSHIYIAYIHPCMNAHIHTVTFYMQAFIGKDMRTHIHARTQRYSYTCICKCICICICTRTSTCTFTCTCTCMCLCICICICMRVYTWFLTPRRPMSSTDAQSFRDTVPPDFSVHGF